MIPKDCIIKARIKKRIDELMDFLKEAHEICPIDTPYEDTDWIGVPSELFEKYGLSKHAIGDSYYGGAMVKVKLEELERLLV